MSFRSREMMKKIMKNIGGEKNIAKGVKEELQRCLPNNKIVMGRAQRGLYAGRHIQYGNNVSEDGGNKTKRNWKPNVQEKRLFSYICDRHIRIRLTTHALRCIDKAGGIDEYLLQTPYHKMDTELGLLWKAKMEKMYEELGKMEVAFVSREDQANLDVQIKKVNLEERPARREAYRETRKKMYFWSPKDENVETEENSADDETHKEGDSQGNNPEQMVAGA